MSADLEQRAREVLAEHLKRDGFANLAMSARGSGCKSMIAAMLAFRAEPSTPSDQPDVRALIERLHGRDIPVAVREMARRLCEADGQDPDLKTGLANGTTPTPPYKWQGYVKLAAAALERLSAPVADREALRVAIHNDCIVFGQIEQRMRECWVGTGKLSDEGSASNDFRVWMNEAHNRQRDLKSVLGQNPNVPLAALRTDPLAGAGERARRDLVHIWSGEHHAYWRRDSAGYTTNGLTAGLYERVTAMQIVAGCAPEKRVSVREIDPSWPIWAAQPITASTAKDGEGER